MDPGPDYILDLGSGTGPAPRHAPRGGFRGRPWISVQWRCCGTYSRVYRNAQATAYLGRCPRCARPARVLIGPGGTDCRFFYVE